MKSMTIDITPEIIDWIEYHRAELAKCPTSLQYFVPGFDEVVKAYDKEMGYYPSGDDMTLKAQKGDD